MTPPVKHRLLLVDDHAIVRQCLKLLVELEADLRVAGEAESVAQAIDLLRKHTYELAIVDISLEGASGLSLVRHIVATHAHTRVIVLTMHDETLYWDRAMAAGAHGFVTKRSAAAELLSAIRAVLAGKIYASAHAQTRLLQVARASGWGTTPSPLDTLSNRELEVLRLIGQGLGSGDIGRRLHRSVKTIDTHKANLKTKLGLSGAAELLRYAAQMAAEADSEFGQ